MLQNTHMLIRFPSYCLLYSKDDVDDDDDERFCY